MAKGNDFKKPVNNEEIIINEESNKRLIFVIVLCIIVVVALIITSISYFSDGNIEEKKKTNKPDNKDTPIEVINPPVVDEKPNDQDNLEEVIPVRKPPVVVVTPEDPVEEIPLISSDNENDYKVTMVGNTAYVSGVSRYLAVSEDGVKNVVQLKVMLNDKYKLEDLTDMIVTTTTNGITNNTFDHIIQTDEVTGKLYFYWRQAIGNGYEKPTSFTIVYGDGLTETYKINLNDLKIEDLVSENEKELIVVPTDGTGIDGAYGGLDFPYTVDIFRQLSSSEIDWLKEEDNEVPEVEESEEIQLEENLDEDNETKEETDYSKDLSYTVRFEKGENFEDGFTDDYKQAFEGTVVKDYDKILVVKVYAPVIDKEGEIVDIIPDNVIITGTRPDGESYTQISETVSIEETEDSTRYYTYLYYAADSEVTQNPTFTIDWDGEGTDYGTYTYEFDLSKLYEEEVKEPEDVEVPSEVEENTNETIEDNPIEETTEVVENELEETIEVFETPTLDVEIIEGTLN